MANYTIIGGDGKEYGPVTETDIRQWIAEGRLNGHSSAKGEGDAEFRELALFPEFAGVLAPVPGLGGLPAAGGVVAEWNEGDYDLDIGACVARGWAVFKGSMGILVGAFLLYLLMSMAFSNIIGLMAPKPGTVSGGMQVVSLLLQVVLGALLTGPLIGGLYFLMLRVIRGEPATIGDLFAGFQRFFLQLYLGQLVVSLLVALCFLPAILILTAKLGPALVQLQQFSQHQQAPSPEQMSQLQGVLHEMFQAVQTSWPVLLVCLIPAVFFQVSLAFVLPLIVDREMKFGAALGASWKMVFRHWWQVLGLLVVNGLIGLAGFFACCVGWFFAMPLSMVVLLVAYESIFLRKKT